MNKETLKEAELNEKEFYNYMAKQNSWKSTGLIIQEFIQLKLKKQQERSYSEEEVHIILNSFKSLISSGYNKPYFDWFEQFKKK